MLTIKDADGVDLVDNPPDVFNVPLRGRARVDVPIVCQIIEDNVDLPVMEVSGTIDWNDGSQPTVFDMAQGTISVDVTNALPAGDYNISVTAQNFVSPSPQTAVVNFHVVVQPDSQPNPDARLLYGPILPKDSGSPNNNTWDFDIGVDVEVLASSVKMLLLTGKGERVTEPDYGTNIRQYLFEPNLPGLENLVSDEIVQAITKWEPRVQLKSPVTMGRDTTNRSVTIVCIFVSRQTQQPFESVLVFSP